ncbi:carbonic anhydrase 2-like [Nylanderia fulva]|uniref:carbonic anhydrase 2-like n=1 Tax=Nylanderia fulva TaxID=613905 RepID=UPI0010FB010C|nr:carbonic anhydrase 2-like [Nylanderia fulva]
MTNSTKVIVLRFTKNGQSPIDLIDKIVQPKRFPPLILNGHWLKDGIATLFNDGNTAKIFLSGDRIPSTISGGPLLNDEYEFYNAHFHWGEDNCRGAEHTINGTWFSMECHVIHWNRKYLTFEECLKHRDGLCVLAFLFLVQSCQCNNVKFDRISENLQYIQNAGSEINIPPNSLSWMRIATNCSSYYTYQGSKTEEPYWECVTWIVFPVIIPIQSHQLNEFRKLKNKKGEFIKSNWRDVQLLRGRRIFLAIS